MTDDELIERLSETMFRLAEDMLSIAMDGHPAQALTVPIPPGSLAESMKPTMHSLAELMVRGPDSAFYQSRREGLRGLMGRPEFLNMLVMAQQNATGNSAPPFDFSTGGVMLFSEEEDA